MSLPPGISFLFRIILVLSIPPVSVGLLARVLAVYVDVALAAWAIWALAFASVPLCIFLRICYRSWSVHRAAARLGATLPPKWEGKSLGNIDTLRLMLRSFQHGYPADFTFRLFDNLGNTARLSILWDYGVLSCDPHVIKTVLATDFNTYEKGKTFKEEMHSLLGTGVFNSDGEMWKWHRSMTRPFFSKDRISHFDLFDRHTEEALAKMSERLRAGYAVDFQDLISRFTLDSATEFLFGSCVHSLHSSLPHPHNHSPMPFSTQATGQVDRADAFATAFQKAQQVVSERATLGKIWPLFEMRKNKTDEYMQVVDEYLGPILEEALRKKKEMAKGGKGDTIMDGEDIEGETLLDNLVRYTSDPVVLHDEVLNILIAGRDTTAASLTFVIYFLCMYPAVLNRLREEVLAKVGPRRRPTYADVKEMRFLRAVINETLRLYPVVPFNIRVSAKEGLLPNPDPNGKPFYVPAGTTVSYSVLAMQRRKEYWGPDADEFDPDRFLDERVNKYLTPNPFIFLPFNAGPRICLGQQFAYNEMSYFLIKLLQRFSSMELAPEAAPPSSLPPAEWAGVSGRKGVEMFWPKTHLTLYSNGGLWVKMTEADDHDVDGHEA